MTAAEKFEAPSDWWKADSGFFGLGYMEGDNSIDGYLEANQSLAERTQIEVSGVEKILELAPGSRVCDCPTGYGRHSIELAKRGHIVTGMDINHDHMSVGIKNGKGLENLNFVEQDMTTLDVHNEFDAVINMFFSFGFFDTDEMNIKVLQNFYNALKPGGKFLMHTDVHIPRIRSGKYKLNETRELTNGRTLAIDEIYDESTKRIVGTWSLFEGDKREKLTPYSVRVFTFGEFAEWCQRVGFRNITGYGDWDGNLLNDDSEDMMIVVQK